MKSQNHFFTFLLLSVTLILSCLIIFIKSKPINQISPITNTSTWKTYSNSKYRFSINYPPESSPTEKIGTEDVGQFSYLFSVNFGKFPFNYPDEFVLDITNKSLEDYRLELIGHITDQIDSESITTVNNIQWNLMNYHIDLSDNKLFFILATTNRSGYSYSITSKTSDITQILSTFKFIEPQESKFCGGIAGLPCPEGFTCQLDGTYPDAGGTCIPN